MKITLKFLSCAALVMLLASCTDRPDSLPDGREGQSVTSSDGSVRFFVWIPQLGGLGATISQPYQVWAQSFGSTKEQELVLEADKTDGVYLSWKNEKELEICYGEANINRFWNRFVLVTSGASEIKITEVILRRMKNFNDCYAR